MGRDINDIVDEMMNARRDILAHAGFPDDTWRYLPLADYRDAYWSVVGNEIKWSSKREALEWWLAEHDDEYGEFADVLYSNAMIAHRRPFRGPMLTAIAVDTNTDGNKWIQILRTDREVKA